MEIKPREVVSFTVHSIGGRSENVIGTVVEVKYNGRMLIVQTETGHGVLAMDVDKATPVPVDWAGRKFGQLSPDEKWRVMQAAARELQAEFAPVTHKLAEEIEMNMDRLD